MSRSRVEAERLVIRITQSRSGFAGLDRWIARQGAVSRIVVESSGHYWQPLASHLRALGHPVAVVNPLASKYFAKRRLARAKSDPADARTLAALGMVDRPAAGEPLTGAELREAARFAMRLVEEQSRVCNRILRLVDLGFPELHKIFDDPTCKTAIALLRVAPTARQAARRTVATLARANRGPSSAPSGPRRPGPSTPRRARRSPSASSRRRSPSRCRCSSSSTSSWSVRSRRRAPRGQPPACR